MKLILVGSIGMTWGTVLGMVLTQQPISPLSALIGIMAGLVALVLGIMNCTGDID